MRELACDEVDEPVPPRLRLRTVDGELLQAPTGRWLAAPTAEEDALLARAVPPVLDVGCGPGRHVAALHHRGVTAVALEPDPQLARLARRRGATVLEASVFGPVPLEGHWGTALLLDGNVGLGGDPVRLLRRVRALLRPGGRVLAELQPPETSPEEVVVRLELRSVPGPWFTLGRVPAETVDVVAGDAELEVIDRWRSGGRWFAELER